MSDVNNDRNPGAGNPPAASKPTATAAKVVSWLPSVSAALILVFFAVLLLRMFDLAATVSDDKQWGRLLFLYNGLEALAFAAAGVLLGERVQRSRALAAEKRADTSDAKADDAQQDAAQAKANGKALKKAVESKVRSSGALESATAAPELAELSDLAERLFPD